VSGFSHQNARPWLHEPSSTWYSFAQAKNVAKSSFGQITILPVKQGALPTI
jgi:hypothetical protein